MPKFLKRDETYIDIVVRIGFEAEHLVSRIVREVNNGNYHDICFEDLTYGNALVNYERTGLVDETTAKSAFIKGRSRRAHLVLKAMAEGRGYELSGFQTTFCQEMDELTDEGYITEMDAYIAEIKGDIRGDIKVGDLFDSMGLNLPELEDPETSTLYISTVKD